ncbi:MAG: nucleoside hydrolase [Actinomycetota bacterium]
MKALGGPVTRVTAAARCASVWRAVILLVLAFVASACGPNAAPAPSDGDTVQLVVDTDMGPDDVRALMMVATDPHIDLLAVTVSGTGLARCPTGAANAKAILEVLDRPDVPVACGPSAPIAGFNLAPTAWRDAADALAGMSLPVAEPDADGAVALLSATLAEAESPVTILTLGPLTNLALTLSGNPSLIDGIDRIIAMAGAFDVGGNTLSFTSPPVAEFNVWFDPVAAEQVLGADIDLTLIPLDATNDVPITPLFHAAFEQVSQDAAPAAQMLRDHLAAAPFVGGVFHWDDLAAAVVTAPHLVSIEQRRVSVRVDPGSDIGATVVRPDGRLVAVAVSADRPAFERYFADAFGLAELDSSGYSGDAEVTFDGTRCVYDGPDPLPAQLIIKVSNTSDRSGLGVSAGVYDSGATAADLEAYWGSQPTAPPYFLTISMIAPLRAQTTSYWRFENSAITTLSCAYDLASGVELAGPRLNPVDD